MQTLTIYEVGTRTVEGKYKKLISSSNRQEVEECADFMKCTTPKDITIVILEKTYHLVSTVPYIVQTNNSTDKE